MRQVTSACIQHKTVSFKADTICLSRVLPALLPIIMATSPITHATEAMIIGGGSNIHNSNNRFEQSVRWAGDVLTYQNIAFTTHFNDGQETGPDIYYNVDNEAQPLAHVFGSDEFQQRRFRNHGLKGVNTSTRLQDLEPAIKSHLENNLNEELLIVHSGFGHQSKHGVSIDLWDNESLSKEQLHRLLRQHDRSTRFIFAHSYSGDFHRLAYRDPAKGLELNSTVHCGFTSQSSYAQAETPANTARTSEYRDYLWYFFSALSGYEPDGQIISRFADLDEDGQTSPREAHLYTLEESMSIDLPLSTSEDYLLRWQPWYLRWQPAQKQLPNNEYTQIFRDLAKRLDIPLNANVARTIRDSMTLTIEQLSVLELQRKHENAQIKRLQTTIRQALVSQWPSLASPYSQGFETLIQSGKLRAVKSLITQFQPEYDILTTAQRQAQRSLYEILGKRRELAQYQKLLRLRHLALIKQQIYQNGTEQQISDYRTLLFCEQAPLKPSTRTTVLSEETTQ